MLRSGLMGTNTHRRIKLKPELRRADEMTDDDLGVIVDAAHRRAALVASMREALEAGDNDLALMLARKVAGLEEAA